MPPSRTVAVREGEQDCAQCERVGTQRLREDHRVQTGDSVQAELDHEPGEEHADAGRRDGMGIGKPQVEGHNGGLDEEAADQQGEGEEYERIVTWATGRVAQQQTDLRHVQRAGHGVQQADAGEREEGGDGVGDREVEGALQWCRLLRFEAAEREGGGAHELEPDEEVEEVGGEHEAAHGGEEDEHQRMEVEIASVDKPPGEEEGKEEQHTRKQGERGGRGIDDEADAEHHRAARKPVTEPVDDRVRGGFAQQSAAEDHVNGREGDRQGVHDTAAEPGTQG